MKKIISIISITVAALILSSCVIIGADEKPEVYVEKKTSKTSSTSTSETTETKTTTTTETKETSPVTVTTPATVEKKYSITCKNQTSIMVTDWCVKKDNIVTYAKSGFNRSIRAGGEDMILDLPEGYYKVYFSFEDDYPLNPEDYYSSNESVYLNKDVTYCLYERQVAVTCRTADSKAQLYLEGSDGSQIDLY